MALSRPAGGGLFPYRSPAIDAGIIVYFPAAQDKEKPFSDRDRLPAAGAIEFRGLKILIGIFLPAGPVRDPVVHGAHRDDVLLAR